MLNVGILLKVFPVEKTKMREKSNQSGSSTSDSDSDSDSSTSSGSSHSSSSSSSSSSSHSSAINKKHEKEKNKNTAVKSNSNEKTSENTENVGNDAKSTKNQSHNEKDEISAKEKSPIIVEKPNEGNVNVSKEDGEHSESENETENDKSSKIDETSAPKEKQNDEKKASKSGSDGEKSANDESKSKSKSIRSEVTEAKNSSSSYRRDAEREDRYRKRSLSRSRSRERRRDRSRNRRRSRSRSRRRHSRSRRSRSRRSRSNSYRNRRKRSHSNDRKRDNDKDKRSKRDRSRSKDREENKAEAISKQQQKTVDILTSKTGGAYIPPAKLRLLQAEITDKTSAAYQRIAWEALKKSIHGFINKVNVDNIGVITRQLLKENIVRGRGLLCRSIIQAQAASPTFTHVYAALVSVINSKFPNIGELLLHRLVIQFKRGFRRNDKAVCISATRFIAHLINQRVAHEILALEILTLLVEMPTDDSVEVAIAFLKECGMKLQEVSSKGINAIFEMLKNILHEGKLEKRVQYMIEVAFQVRKDGFKDHVAVTEALELVEEDDQFTHLIMLDEATDTQDILSMF